MTTALKRAFAEKILQHKTNLQTLRKRQLDSNPERREIYSQEIDRELELLWDLMRAESEQ